MRYLTFAGAFAIYYVGLFVSGVMAFVVLALLVRWACPCRNCRVRRRRGRSTRTTPQHAAATARCAKDSSVRVGRPHDELDELLHNLADEGGEILIMERMNERSW